VLVVPRSKLPHLYLDCGSEDGWLPNSQGFLQVLLANKIPFTYAQSPGEHQGDYWRREISHALAVQCAIIERSLKNAESTSATAIQQ